MAARNHKELTIQEKKTFKKLIMFFSVSLSESLSTFLLESKDIKKVLGKGFLHGHLLFLLPAVPGSKAIQD